MKHADFLVEIHTEELPPKNILKLATAFHQQIIERLQKAELSFSGSHYFATPRRLAVLVKDLAATQPDQVIERKGPALNAAYAKDGKPTPACQGFARSCGITPEELTVIKTDQGEWVGYKQEVTGKSVVQLLPAIVEEALAQLPIPKRMRWSDKETQFTRPIHSLLMLYGADVLDATIMGFKTGRVTRGHRFHAPEWIDIPQADQYESVLETKGHVIADFAKRRERVRNAAIECVHRNLGDHGHVLISSDDLLDEVTGLVEWPVALSGQFDQAFLDVPDEVLISSMQDHQRYFPVVDTKGHLLPYFVTMSNIESKDAKRVIHGNERVLRARLSDAAFFFTTDKKETLASRVDRLRGMVYQAKLGSLFDKVERVGSLASAIAAKISADPQLAARAALLAKADLTTNMVGEFPELQGVMGHYYALHDGEAEEVALAIEEQYKPRFAGDTLPETAVGQALAVADRIDTLVGTFGINQIPTGDKDPYGLRRAALGVLRILIENKINLDLKEVLELAISAYQTKLENPDTKNQIMNFVQERLRAWYLEKGVAADVFASVAALGITNPLDVNERIKAVQAFKKLTEAETLSVANKRVSNILSKYVDTLEAKRIDPNFFDNAAELELAKQLEAKSETVTKLYQDGKYEDVLLQLAELRKPIDDFFDQVMVMTDDKPRRENRILLLSKLRSLFLQVADIALLQ